MASWVSFSSYVRDYDFSVWLLAQQQNQPSFSVPEQRFGDLHGKLFDYVLNSPAYREQFNKPR